MSSQQSETTLNPINADKLMSKHFEEELIDNTMLENTDALLEDEESKVLTYGIVDRCLAIGLTQILKPYQNGQGKPIVAEMASMFEDKTVNAANPSNKGQYIIHTSRIPVDLRIIQSMDMPKKNVCLYLGAKLTPPRDGRPARRITS